MTISAAWLAIRRSAAGAPAAARPWKAKAWGTWALTGALAADGYLQFRCSAAGSLPHLLVFHAGGVMAVALLALAVARRRPGAVRAA